MMGADAVRTDEDSVFAKALTALVLVVFVVVIILMSMIIIFALWHGLLLVTPF